MTTFRQFHLDDLFRFNNINFDELTETYNLNFYLTYMSRWPESFTVAEAANKDLIGYLIGKTEGANKEWHGHVSAVTVAPIYRRIGIARNLMNLYEELSNHLYNAYFVDLFVRKENVLAISMYEKLGYIKYRRVLDYYIEDNGETKDAWDMRKGLDRDRDRKSTVPLDHPVAFDELFSYSENQKK